ncbi:hypothetical protein DFH29DRAFT_421349 [Suillus ampliporus]|nr:hypothetical protein DFH29DRAFT_421349 [Suillus ampliporus]
MDDSVSQDVLRIGDPSVRSQDFADATNEPDLTFAYGRCSHSMHTVGSIRRYSWPCLQYASPSLRMCAYIYGLHILIYLSADPQVLLESAYILAVKFCQAPPFCQPISRTSEPIPQHDFQDIKPNRLHCFPTSDRFSLANLV